MEQRSTGTSHPPSAGFHVAFVLQGLGAGGSERIVNLLCNRMAADGRIVSVFAFEDRHATPYYDYDDRVRVFALGRKSEKAGLVRSISATFGRVAALRACFRRDEPDLIVSFLTRTNVMTILGARGLGVPVIVSERNNPALQTVGPLWNWLRRRTYPRAHGLVTMTRGAMGYFPPAMRRREWVIPNPAIPSAATCDPRPHGRTIVAAGRLVEQKGFDLLLRAFVAVAAAEPDWRLVIWGEGPELGALTRLRGELGLHGRVDFPGVSERPGGWIADADMFVLSSRFEGWGLVLGEAMAAGLPVVSFDCEWGPAEMIRDGEDGLLVADGDVVALADAMARLCGDPDLRDRLGARAKVAMERFAPDRIVARWQDVLDEALGTRRAAAVRTDAPSRRTTEARRVDA